MNPKPEFAIGGPEGEIFRHAETLDTPQRRSYSAPWAARAPEGGWPAEGAYRGYVTLSREGRVLAVRHADVEVLR